MPEMILYITRSDSGVLLDWLNDEEPIAWIIKSGQSGLDYRWRAVDRLEALAPGEYCLWHKATGPLNIPSGDPEVADALVGDPYSGWSQRLDSADAETPWFGSNLPGPYAFRFRPSGRAATDSIGRSGFSWLADRYRPIGLPAVPAARSWWRRLGRFVKARAKPIPWPSSEHPLRSHAFAFPDAFDEIRRGRRFEVNP